ncbi:MAG: hypothetical protein J6R39_05085 [Oscillospiraceae bacterium]|nr:hypothetical protein [Oscillospiraceae bacterium]
MMELVRQWVLGVTCAAFLSAVAAHLGGTGALGQVCRVLGALVLLWAVLSPLPGVELSRMIQPLTQIDAQLEQERQRLNEQSGQTMCAVIEQESGAYILDKARQLGLDCRVQVTCRAQEGVWQPWSVCVTGIAPSQALSRAVEEELGVPRERISYREGGE